MATTQRIYRSLFGTLPYVADDQNVWDFLLSRQSAEGRSSGEPLHVDVRSGSARSMAEVIARAELLARYLCAYFSSASEFSAPRGDASEGCLRSVGLLSPNHLDYPLVIYACLAAGVPVAPISSTSTALEAHYLSQKAQCAIIFVHPECLATIEEAGYPTQQLVLIEAAIGWRGLTLDDLVQIGKESAVIASSGTHPVPAHHVGLILFSSGSTGNPKAVMLTHRNLISALQGELLVIQFARDAMIKKSPHLALQPPDRIVRLIFLPMNHAYGFMLGTLRAMLVNACSCIMPKWDLREALKAIPKYKINVLSFVPAMVTQILAHSNLLNDADLSSIKFVGVGAAAITSARKQKFMKLLAARGAMGGNPNELNMANGYGMSEATVSVTTWPSEVHPCGPPRPGSIGILLPGLEARIICDDSNSPSSEDAVENTAGELWLRGPTIMKGYLNNEVESRAAFTPDGWFKTGDKVRVEADGQMFYVDRLKDTFKNRGLQVAPSEISAVILKHLSETIADAVVIGMPSQISRDIGEEAWAFIVLTPAAHDSKRPESICQQVQNLSREKLSKHKWISKVVIMHELPRGPTHKVLIREIRAQALRSLRNAEPRPKL